MLSLRLQWTLICWSSCAVIFTGCANSSITSRATGVTDSQMVNLAETRRNEGQGVKPPVAGIPTPETRSPATAAAASAQPGKPDPAVSRIALARLSERHGQTRQARDLYEAELQKNPANPLLHHRLAIIAAKEERSDDALRLFESARKLAPDDAELLSDLGYTYYLQHRLDDAEETLRRAVATDPHNKAAQNNLGIVLGVRGKFDEALEHFTQGGTEASAYANLGYVHAQLGEIDLALSNYNRALSLDAGLRTAAEALLQLHELKTKFDPQVAARAADSRKDDVIARGKAPDEEIFAGGTVAELAKVQTGKNDLNSGVISDRKESLPNPSTASVVAKDAGAMNRTVRSDKQADVPSISANDAPAKEAAVFALSGRKPGAYKQAFLIAGFRPSDPIPVRPATGAATGGEIITASYSEDSPGTVRNLGSADEGMENASGSPHAARVHEPAPVFSPSRRILEAQIADAARLALSPSDVTPNRARPEANRVDIGNATNAEQTGLRPAERPAELAPLSTPMAAASAMSELQATMESKHPSAQPTWSASLEPQRQPREQSVTERANSATSYPTRRPAQVP